MSKMGSEFIRQREAGLIDDKGRPVERNQELDNKPLPADKGQENPCKKCGIQLCGKCPEYKPLPPAQTQGIKLTNHYAGLAGAKEKSNQFIYAGACDQLKFDQSQANAQLKPIVETAVRKAREDTAREIFDGINSLLKYGLMSLADVGYHDLETESKTGEYAKLKAHYLAAEGGKD